MTDPKVKLRQLAMGDATMRSFFGTPPATFRWWDLQLVQDSTFPSVTVRLISLVSDYLQQGRVNLSRPRFQFDVRSKDVMEVYAATEALIAWLGTISLAANNQFQSPATMPPNFPNFLLNRRDSMDYALQNPVYVQQLDCRLFNLESL